MRICPAACVCVALLLVSACVPERPPAPEREPFRAARSEHLAPGQCLHQGDCGAGTHCVAVSPLEAVCRQGEPPPGYEHSADNGLPAPPVGLLDGSMLREHARSLR